MGKKKTPKQNQSFQDLVSKANQNALKPFISEQIAHLGNELARQQRDTLESILTKLVVIEKIMMEKVGVSEADFVEKIAEVQDSLVQMEKVEDGIKEGDRVRCILSMKKKEMNDFGPESRKMIDNFGAGSVLGDLEKDLFGTLPGEAKELPFGDDLEHLVKIKVERISRRKEASSDSNG